MITITDMQFNTIVQIPKFNKNKQLIFDDVFAQDLKTGLATYQFEVEKNKEASLIQVGFFCLVKENDRIRTFQITEINENSFSKSIYCEDAGLDLIAELLNGFTAEKSMTLKEYVNAFVGDSGWEIGVDETNGAVRKLEWSGINTATARFRQLAKRFDTEVEYEIELRNDKVFRKLINFKKHIGTTKIKHLNYQKNIKNIKKTESIQNLATALIGIGAEGITLDGYKYSDPENRYELQGNKIIDKAAARIWSRYNSNELTFITQIYESQAKTQERLFAETLKQLKNKSVPEITYQIDFDAKFNDLTIGDEIEIVDHSYMPALTLIARVSSIEKSLLDSNVGKITVTNITELEVPIEEKIAKLSEAIKNTTTNQKDIDNIINNLESKTDDLTNNFESKTDDLENKFNDLNNKADELENKDNELDSKITNVETDLADNEKTFNNKIASVKSELGNTIVTMQNDLGETISVVQNELGQTIKVVQGDVDKQIQNATSAFDAKISETKNELGQTITTLENDFGQQIIVVKNEFGKTVNIIQSNLTSKINTVENKFDRKIETTKNELGQDLTVLENDLGGRITVVKDALGNTVKVIEGTVDDKISDAKQEFDKKISQTKNSLGQSITTLENDFGQRITVVKNKLGETIDIVKGDLNKKIDDTKLTLINKIKSDIAKSEQAFDNKISETKNTLGQTITTLENDLGETTKIVTNVKGEIVSVQNNLDNKINDTKKAFDDKISETKTEIGNLVVMQNDLGETITVVKNELGQTINVIEGNLTKKIEDAESALDGKIANVDSKLDTEVDNINNSVQDIDVILQNKADRSQITEIEKGFAHLEDGYEELKEYGQDLSNLNERLSSIELSQSETQIVVNSISSVFTINENGLLIGKNGSTLQTLQTNDRLSFLDGGKEVAYISGQKMTILSAEFTQSVIIANHIFEKLEDKTLINYIGGE